MIRKSRHPVLLRRNSHRAVTAGGEGQSPSSRRKMCEISERRDRLTHEHVSTIEESDMLNTETAREAVSQIKTNPVLLRRP